jgi:hypothetical protein
MLELAPHILHLIHLVHMNRIDECNTFFKTLCPVVIVKFIKQIMRVISTIYQDTLLEQYNTTEIFSELELHEMRRPKRSIFVSLVLFIFLV